MSQNPTLALTILFLVLMGINVLLALVVKHLMGKKNAQNPEGPEGNDGLNDTLKWAFIAAEFSLPLPPNPWDCGTEPNDDPFVKYREKRARFQREIDHIRELAPATQTSETISSLLESVDHHAETINLYHLAWTEINPQKPKYSYYHTSRKFLKTAKKYSTAIESLKD